ncbi:UNVERIFIED_CONTAM: hypothetical protein GTU68_003311, partial [Idotea baltica]|nr:hypothetical protein [Idotea baltica]
MSEALNQAKAAASAEEVPVGAVAVYDGKLIARAHNLVESKQDATMHAELIVLREAASILKRWRLSDVDIFVTLEPCPMCASALMLSRVRTVYFGAKDPRIGACGSLFDLSQHAAMPH